LTPKSVYQYQIQLTHTPCCWPEAENLGDLIDEQEERQRRMLDIF